MANAPDAHAAIAHPFMPADQATMTPEGIAIAVAAIRAGARKALPSTSPIAPMASMNHSIASTHLVRRLVREGELFVSP
jgi:hypothetical protein